MKIVEKTPLSFSNQKPIQYHWHHGFLSKICVFSKSRKLTHVSLIISLEGTDGFGVLG